MTRRKKIIAGIVALLLLLGVAVAVVIGSGLGDGLVAQQSQRQTRTTTHDGDVATITIDNGASSANTSSAVNGLHVYNPDASENPDLDDYVSGAEAELGTKVSIYVYNLASPVHLYVEHNGEVIVEKDYAQLRATDEGTIDESGVEFIDVVLEGDLVVRTTALDADSSRPAGTSLVNINDTLLGSVSIGDEQVPDGAYIKNGTYDFKVAAKQAMYATMVVDGTQIGRQLIGAGSSYTFASVKVENATVNFTFTEKAVAEASQSAYTVSINNQVRRSDVELDVRWVDFSSGTAQQRDIVSGSSYPTGLELYSRVINRSDQRLRLTATMGGRTVGSVIINPKPANDDATYFGIESFKISGNVVFTLSVEGGSGNAGNTDNTGGTGQASNGGGTIAPNQGGTNQGGTAAAVTGTITIDNGAAAANTSEFVNGLHVYNTSTAQNPTLSDYRSGTAAPLGTRIKVYPYNTASAIHLRVVHNGRVLYDGVVRRIQALNDDAYVEGLVPEFTLAGDLQVTTSLTTLDPIKESRVFVDGESHGSVSLGSTTYANGSSIVNGTYAFTAKAGAQKVQFSVVQNGTVVQTQQIEAGQSASVSVTINADTTFKFEPIAEPEPEPAVTYALNLENRTGADGITVNLTTVDWSTGTPQVLPLTAGSSYAEGTAVFAQIFNSTSKTIKVSAVRGGEVVQSVTVEPRQGVVDGAGALMGSDYEGIVLSSAVTIVVEEAATPAPDPEPQPDPDPDPEPDKYSFTIVNDAASANTDTAVNGLHVYHTTGSWADIEDGEKVAAGSPVEVYAWNMASPVRLTITNGDEVVVDKVLALHDGLDSSTESFDFEVKGDVTVRTSVASAPDPEPEPERSEDEFTLTLNDGASAATNISVGVVNALHVYDAGSSDDWPADLKNGDVITRGQTLCAYVWNTATPVRLTVTVDGQTVINKVYDTDKGGSDLDETTFQVTGDVVVTTAIADASEVEPTVSVPRSLSMTGDTGLWVYDATEYTYDLVEDGATLEDGKTYTWGINAPSAQDVHVKISVGGVVVHDFDLGAGMAHEVDVTVTGDVQIEASPKGTEATTYVVTIDDQVADDVVVRLSSLDFSTGTAVQVPLVAGTSYEAGTKVFVQALNNADYAVKVSAVVDGNVLESTTISAGGAGGLVGAGFDGLLLSGDMTVLVQKVAAPDAQPDVDAGRESEPRDDDEPGTDPATDPEPAASPVLHIQGEKTGWVYLGYTDLADGAELEPGETTLTIYGNEDVDVNVRVLVGGEEQWSGTIAAGYNTEDVTIDVTGDVTVIYSEAAEEPAPEPAPAQYKITVDDQTGASLDLGIFSVAWDGGTPKQVVLESGSSYEEGMGVYARMQNVSDKTVRLTALVDGREVFSTTIAPGDFGGIMASDELPDGVILSGNMTLLLQNA